MSTFQIDQDFSGARLVWTLLHVEQVKLTTNEPDTENLRRRIDRLLDHFEHGLQRSLPRPAIGKRTPNDATLPVPPGDVALFQKLSRLEARQSAEAAFAPTTRPEDEQTIGQRIRGIVNKAASFPDNLNEFALNLTGPGGGLFLFCENAPGGTLRINTKTLHDIVTAADVAGAARAAVQGGKWMLTMEDSFATDRPDRVEKAIRFFESLSKCR